MSAINLCVWALGLGLQIVLVVVLFFRRLVRRFPVFTILIVFYIVRSVLLFALFGQVARNTYNQLYEFLSLADLCLQLLLAGEITLQILRQRSDLTLRRTAKLAACIVLALAIAGGSAALLPARGPVPIDRGSAFAAILMLVLCLAASYLRSEATLRRIAGGFAVYGAAGILAGEARNFAALHHNAGAFAASSYAQAGIYIAVVAYWLFALKARERHTDLHAAS